MSKCLSGMTDWQATLRRLDAEASGARGSDQSDIGE